MTGRKLIVESTLKPILAEEGMRIGSSFYTELEEKVRIMISNACTRARENHRTTVMERDL